jgi:hypothetical protein
MRAVKELLDLYRQSIAKDPRNRPEFVREYHYIAEPKADGYRSVHLVYKYRTESAHLTPFSGLRIEIQIRSRLQHVWATAVEIASTFTGQALKSNRADVDADWKRFFALMSTALARKERCPAVPGTPYDRDQLVGEMQTLCRKLRVFELFDAWSSAVEALIGQAEGAKLFLMELDPGEPGGRPQIEVKAYASGQTAEATSEYLEAEKRIAVDRRDVQVVLVSVDSIEALPRAYPNYYLDTKAFLKELRRLLGIRRKRGAPKRPRIGRKK